MQTEQKPAIDLSTAKHGDEFNTRIGRAYYLAKMLDSGCHVIQHADGAIQIHFSNGMCRYEGKYNLISPVPRKLSGVVNVYKSVASPVHVSKKEADDSAEPGRIACIDLSQFEEGHGL